MVGKLRLQRRRRRAGVVAGRPNQDAAARGNRRGWPTDCAAAPSRNRHADGSGAPSAISGASCGSPVTKLERLAGAALEIVGEEAAFGIGRLRHLEVDGEGPRQQRDAEHDEDRRRHQQAEPGRGHHALAIERHLVAGGDHDREAGEHHQRRHAVERPEPAAGEGDRDRAKPPASARRNRRTAARTARPDCGRSAARVRAAGAASRWRRRPAGRGRDGSAPA